LCRGSAAAHSRRRCGEKVRSEAGAISLSDPIITLTLITAVLWLAVVGRSLQRKEQLRSENGRSENGRRAGSTRLLAEKAEKTRKLVKPAKPRPVASPTSGIKAEVEINPGKCARFAFCEHEAPDIFKLTGERIDYKTTVPPDRIAAVAMAVKVCPARAIKMKIPGSKPYLPQPEVDDDERRPVRR